MKFISCTDLDLKRPVSRSKSQTCDQYHYEFAKERDVSSESGNGRLAQTWQLLTSVTHYQLRSHDEMNPLSSPGQFGELIFPGPEDLKDNELDNLKASYQAIDDPDLRARMGDVLWIRRRDFVAGQAAVDAYIESAKRLHAPDTWVYCHDRLQRALNLSASFGKNGDRYNTVILEIGHVLDASDWPRFRDFPEKLSSLLLDCEAADSDKEATRMANFAKKSDAEGDLSVAINYRILEAIWHGKTNNGTAVEAAGLAIVKLHERQADSEPNPFIIAHHLERAIKAARRLPGQQARSEELIRKLQIAQTKMIQDMPHYNLCQDVTEFAEKSRCEVKSLDFLKSIIALTNMIEPIKVSSAREHVEKSQMKFPLQHLFAPSLHDRKGRTLAKIPAIQLDGKDSEEAILMRMHVFAASAQDGIATAIINPARQQILSEHAASTRDFATIVEFSRFIPPGREKLYARGLAAGLEGDLIEALHILIPQVENSIREVFKEAGVVVIKHLPDRTQRLKDLNDLLTDQRANEILGEDMAFTLRGLLIRPAGSNLRNHFAHGLMEMAEFQSYRCLYLWGLVLRLVVAMTTAPAPAYS